jgi:hypothetical protein
VSSQPQPWPTAAHHVDAHRQHQSDEHREGDERDETAGGMTGSGHGPYRSGMCRSIKTLRRPGETATTGELEAAARQYVRKLSGYREPSAKNREAFETAIAEIAHASQHLVEALGVDVEDGPNRWVGRDGIVRTGA